MLNKQSMGIRQRFLASGLGGAVALFSMVGWGGALVYAANPPLPAKTIDGVAWIAISTAAQLVYLDRNPTAYLNDHIELTRSVDLAGSPWTPLGGNGATPFAGVFNGQGYAITGLQVSVGTGQAGLFGAVSGTVENLSVSGQVEDTAPRANLGLLAGVLTSGQCTNVQGNGTVTGGTQASAGGLAGSIGTSAVVVDSESAATVTASSYSSVGGLVGGSNGAIQDTGSTGSVSLTGSTSTSQGGSLGGLIGDESGGTVSQSYATGSVTGNGATYYAGGLVGYQPGGTIEDAYATGTVSSTNENGGLVGQSYGTITDTYATGLATGSLDSGGLVGYFAGGTVQESYFNTSSGNTVAFGEDTLPTGGTTTGEATAALENQITFAGWSFLAQGGPWAIAPSVNAGMPYLAVVQPVTLPSTVAETPYPATTLEAFDFAGGIQWSATGLPPGLGLSVSGVLSGTPTTDGSYRATVTAKDAGGNQLQTTLALSISPPPSPKIASVTPTTDQLGDTLTVTGSNFGTVPGTVVFSQSGQSIDQSGSALITWTPTSIVTTLPANLRLGSTTVAVTDATGQTSVPADLTVNLGTPTGLKATTITTTGWKQTWDAVYGSTSYQIAINGKTVGSSKAPSWTVTGEMPNTTYAVTVAADDHGHRGAFSRSETVTTLAPIGPSIQVSIPAQATPQGMTTHVVLSPTTPSAPEGSLLSFRIAGFTAQGGTQAYVSQLSTVTVTWPTKTFKGEGVVYWNPMVHSWIPVPSVRESKDTLSFTTRHWSTFALVPATTENMIQRIGGNTRIDTAILAAKIAFPNGASTVVLVNAGQGTPSPDVLSAEGLAGRLNAPLLLTTAKTLSAGDLETIHQLGAKTVDIVGGSQAVGPAIITTLKSAGLGVTVFPGANQFVRSQAVNDVLVHRAAGPQATVYVANGVTLQDVVGAVPLIYQSGAPVVLVTDGQSELPNATQLWLSRAQFAHVVIVGGPTEVSPALVHGIQSLDQNASVTRISAENRGQTAVEFAPYQNSAPSGVIITANGQGASSFVDAFTGAPLAAMDGLPILLTSPGSLSLATSTYLGHQRAIHGVWILGGSAAVQSTVASALKAHITQP